MTLRLLAAGVFVFAFTYGQAQHIPSEQQNSLLYGTAYYNEYNRSDRLDEDIKLMSEAGITVVRMGESTWSLWEPSDGNFDFAWMDRVVDAMGKAHIKVILGTPTYSIPTWMYKAHPEILARPLTGLPTSYGGRQNMDFDNPDFRRYSQRLIEKIVAHYRDNSTVIGWQVDNETGANGAANADVFEGFRRRLISKFHTTDALNKAWILNYWGQDVNDWKNLPTRDAATSTSYKLEWSRWQQSRVTEYLSWQASLVRKHARLGQFITTDFANAMHDDRNEEEISKALDVVSMNSYHPTQGHMDGWSDSEQGDFARSLKHSNYLVTETNAQTTDWSSAFQYPPYDGQLRMNAYTHFASGANMVEYWHWSSIGAGQETYWKGVLSHDQQPGRAYNEVKLTGKELKRIGAHLVDLRVHNDVAILYSVDSLNGINFMPFTHNGPQWSAADPIADYMTVLHQMHKSLYDLNVGVDFVFPEHDDFDRYKLIIVPPLYVADDALLRRLAKYVHDGGHILMTFKSGFVDENSAVRPELAPGPLRQAAGFSYQEFSNLEKPLALRGDPLSAGTDNLVSFWAEFLTLEHARAIAVYEDPFFGKWPAITRNSYGAGTLTYEGTYLSAALQRNLMKEELKAVGLLGVDQTLPSSVRIKHGKNAQGHFLHYYFNYSSAPIEVQYRYNDATDLIGGTSLHKDQSISLNAWDLLIAEESAK